MKREQKTKSWQYMDFQKWKNLNKMLEIRIFKVYYYNTLGNKLDCADISFLVTFKLEEQYMLIIKYREHPEKFNREEKQPWPGAQFVRALSTQAKLQVPSLQEHMLLANVVRAHARSNY